MAIHDDVRDLPAEAGGRSPWSWRIGSLGGVPIRVHVTLLLLLAWIAMSYWLVGGPTATAVGALMLVTVFAIIVVHELGHALMARHFGVRTRQILLLPIGGISSIERVPEQPLQELAVALVGPAINLVLAALLAVGLAAAGASNDPALATTPGVAFAASLVWINVALAVFNLLPAFPLDGGRALRALLSLRMDRDRATGIAATAGKVLALVLAVVGLAVNVWLVLIAAVVWLGARQERELVRVRTSLSGVPAREVMTRRSAVVDVDEPVGFAAVRMMESGTGVLPLVDHGRLVGAVTRGDVATAMHDAGPDTPTWRAPRHPVVRVGPDEPLEHVLDELQASPGAVPVVVEGDTPVGVVTADQLATYVTLHPGHPGQPHARTHRGMQP
ncbi:MAG TPA: site-2 protease family protein [Kofleriaceae bacterium]|nr:site-2 protease family protein [Kofleriaceae bacterium]